MKPYFRNGRKFCAAKCATADCSKRWTRPLQDEADKAGTDPLLENFADNCLAYTLPKGVKMGTSLKKDETNA